MVSKAEWMIVSGYRNTVPKLLHIASDDVNLDFHHSR